MKIIQFNLQKISSNPVLSSVTRATAFKLLELKQQGVYYYPFAKWIGELPDEDLLTLDMLSLRFQGGDEMANQELCILAGMLQSADGCAPMSFADIEHGIQYLLEAVATFSPASNEFNHEEPLERTEMARKMTFADAYI
jgi:hypothetical protein